MPTSPGGSTPRSCGPPRSPRESSGVTRRPGPPSVVTEGRATTPPGELPARSTASVDATGSKASSASAEVLSAAAAGSLAVDQDVIDRGLPSSEAREMSAAEGGDDDASRIHRESYRRYDITEEVVPASGGRSPLLRDDPVQLRPSQLGDDHPPAVAGGECVEEKLEYEGENSEERPMVTFEEHHRGGKVGGEAAAEEAPAGEGDPDNITTPDDDESNAATSHSPGSPKSPSRLRGLKGGDLSGSPPSSSRRKKKTGKGDGGGGKRGSGGVHGSRSPTRRRGRRRGGGGGGCTGGRDWVKEAKRRKKIYKKTAKVAGAHATGAVGVNGVGGPGGDGAGDGVVFSPGTGERWGQGEQWAQHQQQQHQHQQQYDGTQSAVDLGPGYGVQNPTFEQRYVILPLSLLLVKVERAGVGGGYSSSCMP